jgi:hypothetical protein
MTVHTYEKWQAVLTACRGGEIEGEGGQISLFGNMGHKGTGLRAPNAPLHGMPRAHRKSVLATLVEKGYLVARPVDTGVLYTTTPLGEEWLKDVAPLVEKEQEEARQNREAREEARRREQEQHLRDRLALMAETYPTYVQAYGLGSINDHGHFTPDKTGNVDAQYTLFFTKVLENGNGNMDKFRLYNGRANGERIYEQETYELMEQMRVKLKRVRNPKKKELYESFIEQAEERGILTPAQKATARAMMNPKPWF